ncbi:MAG: hypothetical protein IT578_01785 [Verrucomicrobiae bacterium]|nr:hypothetical protein [Verrucomicrobiae bacterium]
MSEEKPGKPSPVLIGVGTLVGAILLLQAAALLSVFWSRTAFGHRFDPVVFSEFETVRSTESVNDTLGLQRAEQARREARRPVQDDVTRAMERAERERARARLQEQQSASLQGAAEKDAAAFQQRGEALLQSGLRQPAAEAFEAALRRAPGYLPAIRRLAPLYEDQGLASQARFLWEKAGSVAGGDPAAAAEIQSNLKRLAGVDDAIRKAGDKPIVLTPVPGLLDAAAPVASAARLRIARVARVDLPLEDLYDLRFRLEFTLDSEGFLGTVELSGVRLEVAFYDQTRGADGIFRPVRVEAPGLPFKLQPRREWIAGERQTLSLNYSVPRGYFRGKTMRSGTAYSYCGIVAKLYFHGELNDRYADSPSLARETGME